MPKLDRLEELWSSLALEIRVGDAHIAALISALQEKRQKFMILDDARRLILKGDGSSAAIANLALEQVEASKDESTTEPPTQAEMVLNYVYESPGQNGVTAKLVAKALHKLGYGSGTTWKNFYNSVTVTLDRWVKLGAIDVVVPLGVGRITRHFTRPHLRDPMVMPDKRVPRWGVPIESGIGSAKNRRPRETPSAAAAIPNKHAPPPAERSGSAAALEKQEPPPAPPSASATLPDKHEPPPAEQSGSAAAPENQEPPPATLSDAVIAPAGDEPTSAPHRTA